MSAASDAEFAGQVRGAASAWRWIPYDAVTVTTAAAQVVVSGEHARAYSTAAAADVSPADLVDEACTVAARAGAITLTWVVPDAEQPAGLADLLVGRGATLVEDLVVMARRLSASLPPPSAPTSVDIRRVDTPQVLARAYAVDSAVLGTPVRSGRFRQAAAALLAEQVAAGPARTQYRFVSTVDDTVVGTAGLTVAGSVARLWGAAVLPAHRGRGIFRALLATRLHHAVACGATFALAKARTGTSAPLLRRVGFGTYGRERHHRLAI